MVVAVVIVVCVCFLFCIAACSVLHRDGDPIELE